MTRVRGLLAGTVLLALVLSACGTAAPDNVRVGVIAPLTGPRAALGQDILAGARFAVADLNADGGLLGHPVELVVIDDADLASVPGQLADLAERARVSAVVGPEAPGVLLGPRSPLTRRDVPVILPSAFGGDLAMGTTFVGRTVPSARSQATALGTWLRQQRQVSQVAVLLADPIEGDIVRDALQDGFVDAGLSVVASVEADGDAADLRPAVGQLRQAAGDVPAVLLWGPPATVARATAAVRALDWDVQLAVPASAFVGEYRAVAGATAEGVVAAFPYDEAWFRGDLVDWMLRYQLRHGLQALPQLDTLVIDIPVVAVAAYDAVQLVARAVDIAGSRVPADVAAALPGADHAGLLKTYVLGTGEAWHPDELYVARFHTHALTFDVDARQDAEAQRELWRAQVTLDLFAEGAAPPAVQALIDRVLRERALDPPSYQEPLPPPHPVGRP